MPNRPGFALLSVIANLERHKLASGEPWLLLMDLQWPGPADPTATQQHIRLVRNSELVNFDANDGHGEQIYTPFNFTMGELAVSSNGSVPESEITASNVMRVLQTTLEQYSGVVGASLNLYVVNAAKLNLGYLEGEPELSLAFTVKQTMSDAKLVHFKLGASSPLRRLFPIHMYRPNFCGWQYKSAQCGYVGVSFTGATAAHSNTVTGVSPLTGIAVGMDVQGAGLPAGTTITAISGSTLTLSANAPLNSDSASLVASLPTCSHTIDGATGCLVHFGTAPMRGLFFPGIDSNGAAVAGVA